MRITCPPPMRPLRPAARAVPGTRLLQPDVRGINRLGSGFALYPGMLTPGWRAAPGGRRWCGGGPRPPGSVGRLRSTPPWNEPGGPGVVAGAPQPARAPPPLNTYRGTSLIGTHTPIGPYSRPMPRVLGGVLGGWAFSCGRGSPVHFPRKPLRKAFLRGGSCPVRSVRFFELPT